MPKQAVPYRQIRALYDDTTITVYQAYNKEIAEAAVKHQRLNASSRFSPTRMTWIKPSWAWMLYRSGYSYKDAGQERILALRLTHAAFLSILQKAVVANHIGNETTTDAKERKAARVKPARVMVQWDPERSFRIGKLDYRSIQIGIPGTLVEELVDGTVEIEDVTEKARQLKKLLDEDDKVDLGTLIERGLFPEEKEFEVEEDTKKILEMDKNIFVVDSALVEM
ncbi:hypothetical protein FB567DRAFT_331944 [Paraphoma chrysanthemicola]|uniref:ATP-dependent RNA helicase DHX8 n=1 Tax=Paraphoma chrysanthemicola TaxID=798071 RepID=A0A8K0VZJ3_9PLEO|nr:hypothetical protein FB567DRAFT_331944 [Paraphoma chrysanthemicola]